MFKWGFIMFISSKTKLCLVIQSVIFSAIATQAWADETEVQTLPTIVVQAEQEETGYTKKQASTATKLSMDVKETPQSVTVISRQQIDDMGVTDIGQLLMNTTGVMLSGDNSARTNFSIRGFGVGDSGKSNLLQYDGVPINAKNVASPKPDVAMIESVEVLRGSAGLSQGSGEPSGAINIIRKKPTADFQGSASVTYGSWDKYRGEVDVSNRLNEDGTVRGRLVLSYQDSDSYLDAVTNESNLVYGIVSADLTPNTLLNVGYSRQGENAIAANNLPRALDGSDLKLDRSTCSCSADDFWDRSNAQGFFDITHTFDNGWKIKGSYTKAKIEMDMVFTSLGQAKGADNIDGYQAYVNKYAYQYDQRLEVIDLMAQGNFNLFGREHELVIGANSQDSDIPGRWTSFDNIQNDYSLDLSSVAGNRLVVDVRNYSPYQLPYIAPRYDMDGGKSFNYTEQLGGYLALRLNPTDKLKVILGDRISQYKYRYDYESNVPANAGIRTTRSQYQDSDIHTPYFGLTYNLTDQLTAYASFTDTYIVQSAKDINDELLDPIQGNSYETGFKWGLNDDKLIATLAGFRVESINRSVDDLNSTGQCPTNGGQGYCKVAAGEVVSQGIETELRGEILPNLNISFGYTYNTTEFGEDPNNQGRVFNETTPEHLLRAFASYKLPNQLTLGAGVNYQSEQVFSRYSAISATQPAFALVNLMASYPINEKLTVSANAYNVLDEKYYSYVTATSNRYGEPRNYALTLRYKF